MPATLNCPACGAPASGINAARCDYCGSTLSSTACPSCFGPMFVGMEFCPSCGARAARVEGQETVACPGCEGTMRAVTVGRTPLFECATCASTWLDADTFSRLCADRDAHSAIAASVGASVASPKPPVGGPVKYRSCPSCKKIMNRQNFGHRSGIVVDVCKGHGVWFEQGELQAVLAFVDRGGLEEARRIDDQRRADELRALEKAARDAGSIIHREYHSTTIHIHGGASDGPIGSILEETLRKLLT